MLDQCYGSPLSPLHPPPLTCDAGHEAGDGEQQRGAGSHGHAAVMCHAVTLSRDCDGDVDGGTLGPDTAPTSALSIVNQGSLGPE